MSHAFDFQHSESVALDYPSIAAAGLQELTELAQLLEAGAAAMQDNPVSEVVVEAIRQLAADIRAGVEVAGRFLPTLRQSHRDDFERHDSPRSREELWDIRKNQQ